MDLKSKVGHRFAPFAVVLDQSRVALFAKAIGLDSPPEDGEPVPPTMLGLGVDPEPFDFLDLFEIPIAKLLHGEQEVTYRSAVRAGDTLCGQKVVVDAFTKKGGTLLFVVLGITYTTPEGKPVCESRQTMVVPQ